MSGKEDAEERGVEVQDDSYDEKVWNCDVKSDSNLFVIKFFLHNF